MNKAGTKELVIGFLLDESGSMNDIYDATISGYNEYVNGQKRDNPEAKFTSKAFEGGRVRTIIGNTVMKNVPALNKQTYAPAGMTNLYDAIGETIEQIDEMLGGLAQEERPAIILNILTDGYENCSRRFNQHQIKTLISQATELEWDISFLGANIDSVSVGATLGLSANQVMDFDVNNIGVAMASASARTTRSGLAKMAGISNEAYYATDTFTAEERQRSAEKKGAKK